MQKCLFICSLVFGCLSAEDAWDGAKYATNSKSQEDSAYAFLQEIELKGNEKILDVGCGDGKITAVLARKVPKGYVLGVDISPSMIAYAEQTYAGQSNLNFKKQDAAHLRVDQTFDLVTSFTAMQWVVDQEGALHKFHKALKPYGKLWIQMPMGLPVELQSAVDTVITKEEWASYFEGFNPPWRFFRPDEYRALLWKARFSPTDIGVVTVNEKFPSRRAFHGFIRQWFPYLRPLPDEFKDRFLEEVLDEYVKQVPADIWGRMIFTVDRLEVKAISLPDRKLTSMSLK